MPKDEIKQTASEFVTAIKGGNKPDALQLFKKLIGQKLKDQLEEKKNTILTNKKF
jgi:hypothetical protein